MNVVQGPVSFSEDGVRLLGKIPVRNLWLLMLYASDLYRQLGSAKIAVEDNPEDIAGLLQALLAEEAVAGGGAIKSDKG